MRLLKNSRVLVFILCLGAVLSAPCLALAGESQATGASQQEIVAGLQKRVAELESKVRELETKIKTLEEGSRRPSERFQYFGPWDRFRQPQDPRYGDPLLPRPRPDLRRNYPQLPNGGFFMPLRPDPR